MKGKEKKNGRISGWRQVAIVKGGKSCRSALVPGEHMKRRMKNNEAEGLRQGSEIKSRDLPLGIRSGKECGRKACRVRMVPH